MKMKKSHNIPLNNCNIFEQQTLVELLDLLLADAGRTGNIFQNHILPGMNH